MLRLNEETEASEEEHDPHQWKGREKEIPSPKGIYRIYGWNSKEPIDDTRTKRYEKRIGTGEIGRDEDFGRVICNNIDSTKLVITN